MNKVVQPHALKHNQKFNCKQYHILNSSNHNTHTHTHTYVHACSLLELYFLVLKHATASLYCRDPALSIDLSMFKIIMYLLL